MKKILSGYAISDISDCWPEDSEYGNPESFECFEDMVICEESFFFEHAEDMSAAKQLLKKGTAVLLENGYALYYSGDLAKLYLLCSEEEDCSSCELYELSGKEITILQAEEILKRSFELKNEEKSRRSSYESWLG